ncbi:MAG: hypothetical protein IJ298_04720 [Ruminococcus sp.]|nr:hypothetical protein [Ruminococcus sp.]
MRLHNTKAHTVVISPSEPAVCESLEAQEISVIHSQCIPQLRNNEQYHADIQLCIVNENAFVPDDNKSIVNIAEKFGYNVILCKPLGGKYPDNIALNVAMINGKLYCKESAVAEEIKTYCKSRGIEIINVNQGYTKCSTLILNNRAIITADETIHIAAEKNGIDVLRIEPGNIYLEGADYGFIGGCSGVIGDTVYFFGDINTHPEAEPIISFIRKQGMNYISLTQGIMKDIGGFICLK